VICHICQKDFSDSVYPYHVARCEAVKQESEEPRTLEEMKLPELKKYAKEHGIDLGEATKIKEVLAVILKAGEADAGGDGKVSGQAEGTATDPD
jgi:hypothetical protein